MSVDINTGSIMSNVKLLMVEKAKEWESFRNIPRFAHVPMAVINPSPRKHKKPVKSPTPNLALTGN